MGGSLALRARAALYRAGRRGPRDRAPAMRVSALRVNDRCRGARREGLPFSCGVAWERKHVAVSTAPTIATTAGDGNNLDVGASPCALCCRDEEIDLGRTRSAPCCHLPCLRPPLGQSGSLPVPARLRPQDLFQDVAEIRRNHAQLRRGDGDRPAQVVDHHGIGIARWLRGRCPVVRLDRRTARPAAGLQGRMALCHPGLQRSPPATPPLLRLLSGRNLLACIYRARRPRVAAFAQHDHRADPVCR